MRLDPIHFLTARAVFLVVPPVELAPAEARRVHREVRLDRGQGQARHLHQPGQDLETAGDYGEEGFVFQQLAPLKSYDGVYPVIGSWLIGHEEGNVAGGMGRYV